MGILDGIVEWFAEQVMKFLDLINSSVLGALGCNMSTFKRYFPAAETMYKVFVALGIGLILLNLVWHLFKNFGAPLGSEAEDPLKLTLRSAVFIMLVYFADEIVDLIHGYLIPSCRRLILKTSIRCCLPFSACAATER